MAFLHLVRHRGCRLTRRLAGYGRTRAAALGAAALAALVLPACGPDPELRPDDRLQQEVGLGRREEVHRVTLAGGEAEVLTPERVTVPVGAWVEFVTLDRWVHEVRFELDSLDAEARAFLMDSRQDASPPMVDADSRFLVSWDGAPAGRYPFLVEGNARPARGVVIVTAEGR